MVPWAHANLPTPEWNKDWFSCFAGLTAMMNLIDKLYYVHVVTSIWHCKQQKMYVCARLDNPNNLMCFWYGHHVWETQL